MPGNIVDEINERLKGSVHSRYHTGLDVGTSEWSFRVRDFGSADNRKINVAILCTNEQELERVNVLMCEEDGTLLDTEPLKRSARKIEFWALFSRVPTSYDLTFQLKR